MGKLTRGTMIGYGIGDLGGNLLFTMTGFYLLFFLTDVVGLAAGLAGTALMIGKVWDAVTDPAVGYLSDRTRSRLGRRKPYLMVGSVVTVGSMILMFSQPLFQAFAWAIMATCLLNTGYTLINIPYGAMTPDLTDDYHERTRLNGWRMSFAVVGTFIGAGAVIPLVAAFGGGSRGWTGMSVVTGLIVALSTMIVVWTVQDPPLDQRQKATGVIRSYREVMSQKPFLLALIPWSLHITGVNIIQGALLYYFRVIYQDEGAFQIALPILLASAIVWIPVWVRISRSIGKRASYNLGMAIFACSVLVFFAIGHRSGPGLAYAVMAIGGVGFATQYVMPFSILPDVVEYDFATNGTRREGVYYGLWTFMAKIGQALGIGLNGLVLQSFGYQESVAGQSIAQPDSALIAIRLLAGPVPALFFFLGIAVLSFYPITNAVYKEIQERSVARKAAE